MEKYLDLKMIDDFIAYLISEEKSEATIKKYERDIKSFSKFIGEDELTKGRVLDFKKEVLSSYAVSGANSMIAAINSFFCYCGWYELRVKRFRVQREAYCPEKKELTKKEYYRLVEAAKKKGDERLCLIIQTICCCGIRVSELCYITVEAAISGEALVQCKGKRRRIFIVSELRTKLLAYAEQKNIKSGMIFITRSGKPVCRHNIWRDMKSLCDDANVDSAKAYPHNLRHLFAKTFYLNEKDIAKLADILGHSSINTTRQYIISSGLEHKKKMENMHLVV